MSTKELEKVALNLTDAELEETPLKINFNKLGTGKKCRKFTTEDAYTDSLYNDLTMFLSVMQTHGDCLKIPQTF